MVGMRRWHPSKVFVMPSGGLVRLPAISAGESVVLSAKSLTAKEI